MATLAGNSIFNLAPINRKLPSPVAAVVRPSLEKLLHFPTLNHVYDSNAAATPAEFAEGCLRTLDITVKAAAADLARIPRKGPIVFVANHPFGGIEGLMLLSLMLRARQDSKVLVNEMLGRIPHLREMCFFVNVFGSPEAQKANIKGMKQTLAWLKGGHAIGVFPSGAVSHLQVSERRVADPKWVNHIAGLARRSGATVVPVYFNGRNGGLFQVAGLIHPRLRTALLPRELVNKQHRTCLVELGTPIPADRMAEFENDDDATQYMRLRTYALAERNSPDGRRAKGRKLARLAMPLFGWARFQKSAPHAAIAPAPRADDLARELDALPADSLLATNGDLGVYVAAHDRIPIVMHELGRQREIAFRAVGEGTGQPLDLDAFDRTYLHLIVWNHAKREMVGGYRMGLVDQITDRVGVRGMYLSTLFHFAPGFLEQLGHAIELGRSFVRPEYQKSFSPLMLLWKGIGRYCAANPRYSKLIGPVSISSRYSMTSRAMMMQTLLAAPLRSPLASLVTPRTPLRLGKKAVNADVLKLGRLLRDVDELCDVVSDIEADGKSIPILLKQYLKLGAKTLAFNVDPAFGNCLDCLCVLDLTQADQRTVYRYMGRENADRFLTAHGIPIPAGLSREPAAV